MWNHSHSNHSSPAGGQQQSTVVATVQQPGSAGLTSPCLNRLQERFDIYRNHSNDQERKYETTFKIMNKNSIDDTKRLIDQHSNTVNNTNNKPTGSKRQTGANKNGSNGSNKRSNPDGGGGGQRCVKSVKQEEDSNKVVSVKVPKLAKITPKVVKVEPGIKEESPNTTIKSEQVYCPLVAPQNGLLMTQSDHFSLEGLTDNVAIGEEELLKLYEELGGTIAPNNLMMMSQQQPINNTAHPQSGISYNHQVVIGRPQFVNSQPPQQQQIYQRFPPQINRPPQFQQQFNDQQQSRFNVQPQMNGPPQLNGQNQMNGQPIVNEQPQMNGQPQLNGPSQVNSQTQLNGQPQVNGQPHFNGQQPQLNVQQLPSNCIQREPQPQHHPTSQGHHVLVQSSGPRQHFDGQHQSQQHFNGQQQVHHQFNGQQQQQSHQSQQFNGSQQHHVQQQNGQQFQQQPQQSWYQYQGFQ